MAVKPQRHTPRHPPSNRRRPPLQSASQAWPERTKHRPRTGTWREVFSIDTRSLALFRMALGTLLLLDLAVRVTDLHAMYTDDGMFSRAEICRRVTTPWNWSFHFGSGSWEYQSVLFGLAGLFGFALLLGFQTRLATIGSWLLLISLHHRVPGILSGAGILLRMLLFWAMFLPLGRTWSLDNSFARRRGQFVDSAHRVFSVGTVAILLQMALMYLCSAVFKTNLEWFRGHVIAGSLAHDFYALPPAAVLLAFPRLLAVLTWATFALEWLGPLLLFSPWRTARLRLVVLGALAAMHLGIAATMAVGQFSYVSLTGLMLFIPREFWNHRWLGRFAVLADRDSLQSRAVPQPIGRSWSARLSEGFCLVALLYVLAVNLNSLPGTPLAPWAPERWKPATTGLGLGQRWSMFEAVPSRNGWYVGWARLFDGSRVDLLRDGAPVDWQRPDFPTRQYPNHYWRKLFREMTYFDSAGYQVYRAPVAEYLCRRWNRRNPTAKHVAEFEFVFCMRATTATSLPASHIVRQRLVRLEFNPEQDRPTVSGYDDGGTLAGEGVAR